MECGGGWWEGEGGRTGALGGTSTMKEEERGREHKMTNTTYILNIYIYIYIQCSHYTKQENIH